MLAELRLKWLTGRKDFGMTPNFFRPVF